MGISKIISGGQTGADRGGLDAAIAYDLPHGGWCPNGQLAEDGVIPAIYNLQEMSTRAYIKRTEANVVDSDATVIFTFGKVSGGSKRTIEFSQKHNKPWFHADLSAHCPDEIMFGSFNTALHAESIVEWLNGDDVPDTSTLNVAGNRESKSLGIQEAVYRVMLDVLNRTNGFKSQAISDQFCNGVTLTPRPPCTALKFRNQKIYLSISVPLSQSQVPRDAIARKLGICMSRGIR